MPTLLRERFAEIAEAPSSQLSQPSQKHADANVITWAKRLIEKHVQQGPSDPALRTAATMEAATTEARDDRGGARNNWLA